MTRILSDNDPNPVFGRTGGSGWLLTVEHAGREVPLSLGNLGLQEAEIDGHIGWDPGALDLAEALAVRLDATMIAQRYSRLVIDCNRPWEAPDLMPEFSDGTAIPANQTAKCDRKMRWDEIHAPFHAAVADTLDRGARRLMAVHTYDPQRRSDAAPRNWPVGLLARVPNPLVTALASHLATVARIAPLGINQPYQIEDESDYTIPVHAEPRGIPHVLIEVRSDYLRDANAVEAMADTIFEACNMLEHA